MWENRERSYWLTQPREDREASHRRWPWSKDWKDGWNFAREREQHVRVMAAGKSMTQWGNRETSECLEWRIHAEPEHVEWRLKDG